MPHPVTTEPLDTFLQQPNIEASPAWEFIDGETSQKPMPTLFHSRLQRNLVNVINQMTERYEAIQELRCIVPPFSPVPDISVIAVGRVPETDGPFEAAPDWVIEIHSPEQSPLKLQKKILHLVENGTQLAWLIDIQREQVWVWEAQELPLIYVKDEIVPSVENILQLTVANIVALTRQR